MGGVASGIKGLFDKAADIGSSALHGIGAGDLAGDDPAKRAREKAGRKAERAKLEARRKLKIMPDKDVMRTQQRKMAARRRARGSGRSSTVLSSPDSGLGG